MKSSHTARDNNRRILLIEPPFFRLLKDTYSLHRFPLSLAYLAGEIKKKTAWDVMVHNADFHPQNDRKEVTYLTGQGYKNYKSSLLDLSRPVWKEIKSVIGSYNPSVVGISAKSQNFASARLVARLAKENNERTIVILGGPHPSMVKGDILDCPHIDAGVSGEGEQTIVEFLNTINRKKRWDGLPGIFFRKNSRIIENPPRTFIKDLDSLAFPHQVAPEVLKDYNRYPPSAFKYIFATRGCPYDCFFCGSRKVWGRRVRFRSPTNVAEEIKSLRKKGLKSIHFDDDTFGINKSYIKDLCRTLAKHCPGLKWSCELHVLLVDQETVSLMKSAGCYAVQIGIESGNNEILNQMRKQFTVEEALRACQIIKKQGIELHAFFIVGFPQETEETLDETLSLMQQIKTDQLIYSVFTPYPGTEAFSYCEEKGLIKDVHDLSLYHHRSPANCFCLNISPEKFRTKVSKIEKTVDRKNKTNRMKRVFSTNTLWRVQEIGIKESIRQGIRIFLSR